MMKKIVLFIVLLISAGANAQAQFQNPIFAGDHADPSILRDGENYYIVHSSFNYYPGLQIWTSTDLVNWKPVTHALHKNVGAVWAPDIVKHNNKFYIYFPANNTNFVVWADKISGPWSDPIDLKTGNIDPGHFADEKGNRYLYFSNGSYIPLSKDGLSVIGEQKHSYDGWPITGNLPIECFCLEGPKVSKRGDYYYLTVAEGGTAGPATSHMVVSARAKSPLGPWENSPHNPVLRTMDASEKWWSKGHATIIDDVKGNWWMVFHGYEKDYYNMGRQTLLQPIEWTKDGWFKMKDGVKTDGLITKPAGKTSQGTATLSDSFTGTTLNPQWQFYNEYDTSRFSTGKGGLTLKAKGNNAGDSAPLLCTPMHHSYRADVEVEIEGDATAGLILFYNNRFYTGITADSKNINVILRSWQFPTKPGVNKKHLFLRLEKKEQLADMYYSTDGKQWNRIENTLEVASYNHNALSEFLSLRLGLSAAGNGQVTFRNFTYTPIADK